jgi:hypothetical protein
MGRDKQKVGDINELRATIKFLKEGYWVFRNVSPKGPIDMVLVHEKTGEVRKIDVKTNSYRQSWKPGTKIYRMRKEEQVKLNVELEFFDRDEEL